MFSNYHCILVDGDGHLIRFCAPARYAQEEMRGIATTHNKYTKNILHQAFNLS